MHSPADIPAGFFSWEVWVVLAGGMLALMGGTAGWMLHAWRTRMLPANARRALPPELSHAEAQFRFIFESVPVGISLKFRERGKICSGISMTSICASPG